MKQSLTNVLDEHLQNLDFQIEGRENVELVDPCFLSFIFNAHTDASRSRQGLSNEYLLAKFGFAAAEPVRPLKFAKRELDTTSAVLQSS